MRLPKADYAEYDYPDSGCDLRPACLTCDLPRCQFDTPEAGQPSPVKQVRNEGILLAMQHTGASATELARQFSVSKRTVHRILQAARQ